MLKYFYSFSTTALLCHLKAGALGRNISWYLGGISCLSLVLYGIRCFHVRKESIIGALYMPLSLDISGKVGTVIYLFYREICGLGGLNVLTQLIHQRFDGGAVYRHPGQVSAHITTPLNITSEVSEM